MSLIRKCLLLSALALIMKGVLCGPAGQRFPWLTTKTECDTEYEILKICQICAVKTKSKDVYPMCCMNKEEARDWCGKYINFGIQ